MMTTDTMDTAERNDADLVAESLDGHRDAFRQIVERYQTLVCSLAYSATGNVSQSEDLAQETFISAWKDLRLLREPDKLRAWLCAIVRNKVHRSVREDGREPVRNAASLDDARESSATEELPSEQAVSREEEAILWRSLERIPENYREPLILFYREHKSIEHVAVELELSEDVVRQRLSRGRKLLQEEVQSFVENTLRRTAPGQVFSGVVLAALPMAAGATVTAGVGLGAKGSAAAKSGLLAAWLLPCVGMFAGFAAQWVLFTGGNSGRERRAKRAGIILAWIVVLAFSIGGQVCVRLLGERLGWHDRELFCGMAWFWWLYAMAVATWVVGVYRWTRKSCRLAVASGGVPRPVTVSMSPGMRLLTIMGTNLMLFWCVIFLAWHSADRMTAGIIAGIMLAMDWWHFHSSRRNEGRAPEITYIIQLASSCAVMLAIFVLRFNAWAACWYGVSTAELRRQLPTQMVPLLTLALAVWVGLLLALTRPKVGAR
jgi:RNA polymerase sigma factor (sigma-70 family)